MGTSPGWYADPGAPGQVRYFDGTNWTEHVQPDPSALTIQQVAPPPGQYPQPTHYPHAGQYPHQQAAPYYQPVQQVQVNQISVAPQQEKSVAVALVLTFFFGPRGMLYSTVAGGLIMLAANVVLGTLTFGLFLFISWPIQMIWAATAASKTKQQVPTVSLQSMPMSPVAPHQQAPYAQDQYVQAPYPQAPQPQAPQPQPGAPTGAMPALPQHTGPDPFAPPTGELPAPKQGQSSNWYS